MLDFIFIIGTSGVGKSTLAQGLLNHYRTTCIEQHMIPEFISRDGTEEMTGALEELTCWENTKAMALCFHRLGYQNIIISDIDDLRTADIPVDFKGYRYQTIKLVCTDARQLHDQMANRVDGLTDFELQEKCSRLTISRPPLINEITIDIAGLNEHEVLSQAIELLEKTTPITDYNYTKPDRTHFYSWVFSNDLR